MTWDEFLADVSMPANTFMWRTGTSWTSSRNGVAWLIFLAEWPSHARSRRIRRMVDRSDLSHGAWRALKTRSV
jgi:hypothetical protein